MPRMFTAAPYPGSGRRGEARRAWLLRRVLEAAWVVAMAVATVVAIVVPMVVAGMACGLPVAHAAPDQAGARSAASGTDAPRGAPYIEPGRQREIRALLMPFATGEPLPGGWTVQQVDVALASFDVVLTPDAAAATDTEPDRTAFVRFQHPGASADASIPTDAAPKRTTRHFAVWASGAPDAVVEALAAAVRAREGETFWTAFEVAANSDPWLPPRGDGIRPEGEDDGDGAPSPPEGVPGLAAAVLAALVLLRFGLWRRRRTASPAGAPRVGARLGRAAGGTATVLTATACLAECALWAAGAAPPPPARSAEADRYEVENQLNALGIREPWAEVPAREPGERRVAFVGDSFTFGEAVTREQAFPHVVSELAAARLGPGRVRTFNLGIMDNAPPQEAARYRRLEAALDVDVLVLVAYLNDFTTENPASLLADIYGVGDRPSWLAQRSLLAAHVETTVKNRLVRARAISYYRTTIAEDVTHTSGPLVESLDAISALKAHCVATGVSFRLVLFPWLFELDDYPVEEFHRFFRAFASEQSIPLLDLLETYRDADAESMRVSAANEHPSVEAHRMAAEAMWEFLEGELTPR